MGAMRVGVVAVVLAVVVGGAGVGTYFAVRNRSSGTEESVTGESAQTAMGQGANFDDRNLAVVRFDNLTGVSYSQFGLGDNRLCPPFDDVGGMCLLPDQVLADIRLLSSFSNRVRTYSLLCEEAMRGFLDYAVENGMEIMLGLFVSADPAVFDSELEIFEGIVADYGDTGVLAYIGVGNEAVFVQGATVSQLVDAIERTRAVVTGAGLDIPIGTAEILNQYMGIETEGVEGLTVDTSQDYGLVLDVVDFAGINVHAYYNGIDPTTDDAGANILGNVDSFRDFLLEEGYPDIEVIVTETGYPSAGGSETVGNSTAVASLEGQQIALEQIEMMARDNNIIVFLFEPWDGDWKRRWEPFIEVDYNFGFYLCDRTQKVPLPAGPPRT